MFNAKSRIEKITKNVTELERAASAAAALPLAALAVRNLSKKSWGTGIFSLASAAALAFRAASGYCPLYGALGINRHNINSSESASVKSNEGIKVEKSITVQRPASELFQYWKNFQNLPLIMKHLKSVTLSGNGRSHWVAEAPLGQSIEWDAEIISEKENEVIAWKSVENSEVNNAGSVRFKELRGDHGTEIKVNLKYDPPGGKLGAVLAKLFRKDAETEIEDDLRRFKQSIEAGDIPSTEGQSSARMIS